VKLTATNSKQRNNNLLIIKQRARKYITYPAFFQSVRIPVFINSVYFLLLFVLDI